MNRGVLKAVLLCVIVFGALLARDHVFAATLYMDPGEAFGFRADTITINIRLDTDEGECVNTIDGSIAYDESISAIDVGTGESILSLWVERPTIDQGTRTIRLAGGIPNGYCGRIPGDPRLTNTIATLVFQVPGFAVGGKSGSSSKEAKITFTPETRVLLNDGEGTEATLKTYGATIRLDDKPGASVSDPWALAVSGDQNPPAPFSLELVKNPDVFNNKYYIVFSTTDKESGLDHFEVLEEPFEELSLFKWGAPDRAWAEVTSPYVIKDQALRSVIRVKAVDKSGNERIATYAPEGTARLVDPLSAIIVGVLGLLVLILIVWCGYIMRKRIQRRRAANRAVSPSPQEEMHEQEARLEASQDTADTTPPEESEVPETKLVIKKKPRAKKKISPKKIKATKKQVEITDIPTGGLVDKEEV
jgi:Tfp pilus assembly protein PilE